MGAAQSQSIRRDTGLSAAGTSRPRSPLRHRKRAQAPFTGSPLYGDSAPGSGPVGGGEVVDRIVEAAEAVEGRTPVGFGVDLRTVGEAEGLVAGRGHGGNFHRVYVEVSVPVAGEHQLLSFRREGRKPRTERLESWCWVLLRAHLRLRNARRARARKISGVGTATPPPCCLSCRLVVTLRGPQTCESGLQRF